MRLLRVFGISKKAREAKAKQEQMNHHNAITTGLRFIAFWVSITVILAGSVSAQDAAAESRLCGIQSDLQYVRPLDDAGGIHITSNGTLRVLIVFASFPDDETPHPYWPAHNPPLFMQQFIDPDTSMHSQAPYNLTNYFNQMSLGQFHLVGEAIWVETAHSQEEYRNGSYGRANWSILQERVDSMVDFTLYDQWTKDANYLHRNVPDGLVDMVIMVWRTNIWEYLGEASLGYKPGFFVDGKRIEMGFPERFDFPLGSGVTCKYPYTDTPLQVMQTMVHELGHWLLGGSHPYNGTTIFGKHAYWGILCNGQRVASCANTYERERLGWMTVPEIQMDQDISLTDYLSTGVAYKYHPDNGEPFEYFYVENHQKLSVFDDVTKRPDDKGVWVLHQQGPYMELDNLKIKPSDGYWRWENPFNTTACYAQELPVFRRGVPGTMTGESHRDQIPTHTSIVNWMYVLEDDAGEVSCGSFFTGEHFAGAFRLDSNAVFSPFSNPNNQTWGNQPTSFSFEVVNETGSAVTIHTNSNPLTGKPATRYLGVDPTIHDTIPGRISVAWGAQWTEGQPLEGDVNWSELQRQIGNGGTWSTVYAGSATRWSDASIFYDTSGAVHVLFRARVRDTQGKYSTWSKVFYTATATPSGVSNRESQGGTQYELEDNYPNPFNPATTIGFTVPASQAGSQGSEFVSLKVYDVLGREVRTLVDAEVKAGKYERAFDAAGLAGGVYLYRLHAGDFVATKKLLLLK